MGDRVSISFKNGNDESVTLCSHWGGYEFVKTAERYTRKLLKESKKNGESLPLDRLEPETVMVDFIREITKEEKRVDSDLYIVPTPNDCDNSDNGHFVIDLLTGEAEK